MNLNEMTHRELVSYLHANMANEAVSDKERSFIAGGAVKSIQGWGRLTWKQERWALSIAKRIVQSENKSRYETLPNLKGVYEIFETASGNLKYPKITFQSDRLGTIRIQRAGDKSRYPGQLMVTDGRRFGENQFFGRIDREGVFQAGFDSLTDDQISFLERFSEDPVALAKEYAAESGNCCFCHKELTDDRSTSVGYGPVCAKNYGLAWG